MIMKKLLLALMIVAGLAATAQPEFFRGAASKKVDTKMVTGGYYLGQYEDPTGVNEDLDCWIMQDESSILGITRKKNMVLSLYDINFKTIRSLEIPESNNYTLLAATMDANIASLLVADLSDNKRTAVYTAQIDLDSMALVYDSTRFTQYAEYTYERKDRCLQWYATSPNCRYTGLVTIIEHHATKQYSATATLFDARMRTVWEKEYAMGTMENLLVTDNGVLVSLGYENDVEQTHFIFNVLNQTKAETYDVQVKCDPIRTMKLVNVVGSHAIAMGTFHPSTGRHAEKLCGGVVGLSFNIDSAVLTGFTMRPFQNEDLNILFNKKTTKVQRDHTPNLISPVAYAPTSFGAVIAVGRNYQATRVASNGSISGTFHREGLHVVALNENGDVMWARNFRRNDIQDEATSLLNVSLVESRDSVRLIKNECVKYPNDYNLTKAAKDLTIGDKSNLVIYSISRNGDVEKHKIESKSKLALIKTIIRKDGSLMLLSAGTNDRARMATLLF